MGVNIANILNKATKAEGGVKSVNRADAGELFARIEDQYFAETNINLGMLMKLAPQMIRLLPPHIKNMITKKPDHG